MSHAPISLVPLVSVSDLGRSIRFYERLGFEVAGTHAQGGSEPTWAELRADGAALLLGRAEGPVRPEAQGVLLYLYVDDVEARHRALSEAGLDPGPLRRPFYCPGGEFEVADPDGYRLVLAHT